MTDGTADRTDAPTTYVALGDSYAAGVGAGNYIEDGSACLRSQDSYPAIIASANGFALHLAACPGATLDDLPAQLRALSEQTDLVSLTIGGNDTGFGGGVTECLKPDWWGDCAPVLTESRHILARELPDRLDEVFTEIAGRAPQARVVVTGYPRLFSAVDCHVATFFSPGEMTGINAVIDELNALLRRRAKAAGFGFADVAVAFAGHAVCDRPAWIHNVRFPRLGESFHPNPAGHLALANVVAPVLLGRQGVRAFTPESAAEHAVAQLTTEDCTVADPFTGEAHLPDLDQADARAAAAAAGVDEAEMEALKWALLKGGTKLGPAERRAVERSYRTR